MCTVRTNVNAVARNQNRQGRECKTWLAGYVMIMADIGHIQLLDSIDAK